MAKKVSKAKAKEPKKEIASLAWDVYARRKGERVYLGLFTDKTKALQYAERKGHHRSVVSFVEKKAVSTQSGRDSVSTHTDVD